MNVRVRILFIFLGLATALSCRQQKTQPPVAPTAAATKPLFQKPPSLSTDTLYIKAVAAVFFEADAAQVKQVQSSIPAATFNSMTHEFVYQVRNAKRVLHQHWPGVTILDEKKYRWLLFERKDGKKDLVDLDHNNDIRGLYLFNRQDAPLITDMMNIDTEAGFYFNTKR